ncbi:MAG: ChaN family lipoprotein [Pseudomonadota bacterium]
MRIRRSPSLFLFMVLFAMTACSTTKPQMPPLASIEGVQGHFRIGRIIHLKTGKAISFDQLIDQVGPRRLIFIGEVHNNPEHHLIQVQILQALMSRYAPRTVAMEFFNKTQQPVLDRYMDGSPTEATETVFLKDVGWDKNWAYTYHFYRPLLLMTKEKGRKILAINAPNNIVKKVARSGLSSLDPSERNQLASHINLKNESHRTYLRKIYEKHTHQDLKRFDFFYQAQCVWEDTMAENIAKYLSKNKEKLVVLAGNGHIINKYGIPNRTLSRIKIPMATILLQPLTGPLNIERKMADYIWLTGDCSGYNF